MKKISNFFVKTNNIQRSSYIWNVLACTSSSFQSMLLLLIITRCENTEDAAIFTIAYSVASLLLFVGKYGVRNFQVSDINEEFSFGEYRAHRYVTTIAMTLCTVVYVIWGYAGKNYTSYKCLCMLALIAPKIIEAFEDVLHGHFHQKGRLDVASKIWGVRNMVYIIVFCVMYIVSRDLLLTSVVGALTVLLLCIVFNCSVYNTFERVDTYKKESVLAILKNCFPIALSTTLMAYVANAPKYTVDGLVNSEEQTVFSVIFMPVFVMTLLGNYIFNPMIRKMTILWEKKDSKEFWKLICKVVGIIVAITVVVLVGGELIGLFLLEILYKVKLSHYSVHMGILIVAGGLLTVLNFMIIVATIIRKQSFLQGVIAIGTVLCLLFSKTALMKFDVLGLVVFFAVVLLLLSLLALVGIKRFISCNNE